MLLEGRVEDTAMIRWSRVMKRLLLFGEFGYPERQTNPLSCTKNEIKRSVSIKVALTLAVICHPVRDLVMAGCGGLKEQNLSVYSGHGIRPGRMSDLLS